MPDVPLYLKTDDDTPWPQDPSSISWPARGRICVATTRSTVSSVPAVLRPPPASPRTDAWCNCAPRSEHAALEYAVGFFDGRYRHHGAEAVVLLLWDLEPRRYRLHVPEQFAAVSQAPMAADR